MPQNCSGGFIPVGISNEQIVAIPAPLSAASLDSLAELQAACDGPLAKALGPCRTWSSCVEAAKRRSTIRMIGSRASGEGVAA